MNKTRRFKAKTRRRIKRAACIHLTRAMSSLTHEEWIREIDRVAHLMKKKYSPLGA